MKKNVLCDQRIVIDEGVIAKSPLSFDDVLVLLALKQGVDFVCTLENLKERGYAVYYKGEYYITPTSKDILRDILLASENIMKTDDLEKLAKGLIEIFPEGIKENTSLHWRCSEKEVILRLREYFKMYGQTPYEEILDAARRYVSSFGKDRTNMRVLRNFIWKTETTNGVPEFISDLATWVANKGKTTPANPSKLDIVTL